MTEVGEEGNGEAWKGSGSLWNAQDRTRKEEEHSGRLEFSLGAHNCKCGGWVLYVEAWFCSPAEAKGKDRVADEVQRRCCEWL